MTLRAATPLLSPLLRGLAPRVVGQGSLCRQEVVQGGVGPREARPPPLPHQLPNVATARVLTQSVTGTFE